MHIGRPRVIKMDSFSLDKIYVYVAIHWTRIYGPVVGETDDERTLAGDDAFLYEDSFFFSVEFVLEEEEKEKE